MLCIAATIMVVGCTDNERARNWGGKETVILPKGKKLINVTWKQDELWYLVRERHENETPEVYEFAEKSSWGILEGKVEFVEQ